VEVPEVLAQKGLRLHNALAILKPRRELILHLANVSDRPVNLPKNYAICLAEPYAGPTHENTGDSQPADVGADPLFAAGPTDDHQPTEAPSVSVEAQAPKTSGPLQDLVPPNQEQPEPSPSPRVAYEMTPPDLHPALHRLMDRYKGL